MHGCQFLKEANRLLKPGGQLTLITPNLSAWFNIFLLVIGQVPSSGPHPDSEFLLRKNTPIQFRDAGVSHLDPWHCHQMLFNCRT